MQSNLIAATPTRIFVSYSRKDTAFAVWLREQLQSETIEVLRDIDETLPGEEWWARLKQLIEEADTIIFVISPRSVASKVCADEVAFAQELSKRIIPVVLEAVDWGAVPGGLSKLHSLYFDDQSVEARSTQLTALIKALATDIRWLREHRRLQSLASRWGVRQKRNTDLLRGQALAEAERWLTSQPVTTARPTALHLEYIQASRDAETRKRRIMLSVSVLAVFGLSFLAMLFYMQRIEAEQLTQVAKEHEGAARLNEQRAGEAEKKAKQNEALAKNQARIARINATKLLAQRSNALLAKRDRDPARLVALEALRQLSEPHDLSAHPDAFRALYSAYLSIHGTPVEARFDGEPEEVILSKDRSLAAIRVMKSGPNFQLQDYTIIVDWKTLAPLGRIVIEPGNQKVLNFSEDNTEINISQTLPRSRVVRTYTLSGEQRRTISLPLHYKWSTTKAEVDVNDFLKATMHGNRSLFFQYENEYLTVGNVGTQELQAFKLPEKIKYAVFREASEDILVLTDSGHLYGIQPRAMISRHLSTLRIAGDIDDFIALPEHPNRRQPRLDVSPDGALVALLGKDNRLYIFSARNGELRRETEPHKLFATSIQFITNSIVLTTADDARLYLWDGMTGALMGLSHRLPSVITSIFVDGDSTHARVITRDGEVHRIPIFRDYEKFMNENISRAGRCLASAEREMYSLIADVPSWCSDLGKWPFNGASNNDNALMGAAISILTQEIGFRLISSFRYSETCKADRELLALHSLRTRLSFVLHRNEYYRELRLGGLATQRDEKALKRYFGLVRWLDIPAREVLHELGVPVLVELLLEYNGVIKGVAGWEEKFNVLSKNLQAEREMKRRVFQETGFPEPRNKCLMETSPDISVSIDAWLYSFWLRRRMEGSFGFTETVLKYVRHEMRRGP